MTETSDYRSELISRLRAATADIAWAVRGLGPAQSTYTPTRTEWSIHEHVAHLRDMEQQVYLPLLRWATVPEMLDPLDYSRKAWHQHRYDPNEQLSSILADIYRIRDEELAIFEEMSDQIWERLREDSRWGPISCQWLAELMYRHALDHLQGIMALNQDLHLLALQPSSLVSEGYIGGKS